MKNNVKTTQLFIATFFILAIFSITSCDKSPDLAQHIYDKNYFFTVNINGKTYTTYAWYDKDNPSLSDTPYIKGVYTVKADPYLDPWRLYIYAKADRIQNVQVPGTCSAEISLTKSGDFLGAYSIVSTITSLLYEIDGKSYTISPGDAVFNVNHFSPPGTSIPVVEGTFQCTCYDPHGKRSFPATGSFRLKVK